jgi:hypothetical protein
MIIKDIARQHIPPLFGIVNDPTQYLRDVVGCLEVWFHVSAFPVHRTNGRLRKTYGIGISYQQMAYLRKRFCFVQFLNTPQAFKNGLVIQPMSALGPVGLLDQTHGGVIMNGLAGEGGVLDDLTNPKELGGHLKLIFRLHLHRPALSTELRVKKRASVSY